MSENKKDEVKKTHEGDGHTDPNRKPDGEFAPGKDAKEGKTEEKKDAHK